MSLFSLVVALLLEQLKPLHTRQHLSGWLSGYLEYFQQHFNSGEYSHGKAAWWLAIFPILFAATAVFWGLSYLHPILALLFNILALYLSFGFGRFSHGFTDIQQALQSGKLVEARAMLSALCGKPVDGLNAEQVACVTIETSLLAALQHLFGVIVWFVIFSLSGAGGAAGALLYCAVRTLRTHWADELNEDESKFCDYACQMSVRIEWLPVRLTAATFAIVGNFEDTVYCWRSQAASWPDSETGILLASAAGASGVRLGLPVMQAGQRIERAELGVGEQMGSAALQSTIRLVWRSVLFMMLMLFMLTLASLLR